MLRCSRLPRSLIEEYAGRFEVRRLQFIQRCEASLTRQTRPHGAARFTLTPRVRRGGCMIVKWIYSYCYSDFVHVS